MPQGVEYDEDYVQSENPVVQAHAIVHGTNPDVRIIPKASSSILCHLCPLSIVTENNITAEDLALITLTLVDPRN